MLISDAICIYRHDGRSICEGLPARYWQAVCPAIRQASLIRSWGTSILLLPAAPFSLYMSFHGSIKSHTDIRNIFRPYVQQNLPHRCWYILIQMVFNSYRYSPFIRHATNTYLTRSFHNMVCTGPVYCFLLIPMYMLWHIYQYVLRMFVEKSCTYQSYWNPMTICIFFLSGQNQHRLNQCTQYINMYPACLSKKPVHTDLMNTSWPYVLSVSEVKTGTD